ncbi:MAG: cytochrome P450 [Acidobacteriota bacterium]|nr:cytochrome P450 [Acidobacteriota bacterium]
MTESAALLTVDPYSPVFQRDPFPTYDALRAQAPVYKVPGAEFHIVSSMALIREVLADPTTYANSVTRGRRTPPPPEVADEVERIRAQGVPYVPTLNGSDPPDHARMRRLVSRAFTPRALEWMDPVVTQIAVELVESLPRTGTFDLIDALARPLPIYAICRILGLPAGLRNDIARWSDAATASLAAAPMDPHRWIETEEATLDYQRAILAVIAERRSTPGDDVLSLLVQPDETGETLSDAELVWFVRELLVAGNETTTKLLADLVLRMDDRPELWRLLRDQPGRAADIVEEGLRLASPVHGMFRRVSRDTVLGGVHLEKDATLFLSFLSANRDEDHFDDADALDIDRPNTRSHLSFGRGIHVCLGASLARKEATICLVELARVGMLRVEQGQSLEFAPTFLLRGVTGLHVHIDGLVGED